MRPRYGQFWKRDLCACHWKQEVEAGRHEYSLQAARLAAQDVAARCQELVMPCTSDCDPRVEPRLGRRVQAPKVHLKLLPAGKIGRIDDVTATDVRDPVPRRVLYDTAASVCSLLEHTDATLLMGGRALCVTYSHESRSRDPNPTVPFSQFRRG